MLIEFSSDPNPLYWKTRVNPDEYRILEVEIETYNIWIVNFLASGKAPRCSYTKEYLNGANNLIISQDPGYQKVFGKRHPQIGYFEYGFRLINMNDPDNDDDQYLIEQHRSGEIDRLDRQDLIDILTNPHDEYQFYMGYRILPMTQKLLDEYRIE